MFVADFLGVSNLLAADAVGPRRQRVLRAGRRPHFRAQQGAIEARGEVKAMIRPERIVIEPHAAPATTGCPAWSSGRSSSAARTRCTCACSAAT